MPRTSDKRERLLGAARELIHRHGYKQTTLADIAEAADVPVGNVYYYFKTKDELTTAVIEQHRETIEANQAQWAQLSDPRQRLDALVDLVIETQDAIANHGCPYGSLCTELNKDNAAIAPYADDLLKTHLDWIEGQFAALGYGDQSRELAVQMLVRLQGISVVGNALHDPELVRSQALQLKAWLVALS